MSPAPLILGFLISNKLDPDDGHNQHQLGDCRPCALFGLVLTHWRRLVEAIDSPAATGTVSMTWGGAPPGSSIAAFKRKSGIVHFTHELRPQRLIALLPHRTAEHE
jgi:hypothetical protein